MKELTIKQNLVWNSVGSLIYQGCQWLTTIVVVLLSSSYENSGVLTLAMSIGNVYSSLATYNMRSYQVSDVKGVFTSSNYVGFRLVTVFGAYAICAIYAFSTSASALIGWTIVAFLLFKADESFVNVLYGIDQRASRMDYIGISQMGRGVLCILLFSFSLVEFDSLLAAVLSMFAGCIAVTFFYDIPHAGRLEPVRPRLDRSIFMKMLRTCLPVVGALVLYGLVATVARQWFSVRFGSEALGMYGAVATPCVIVQVLANYLYSPFLVPIAKKRAEGDRPGLVKLLAKTIGSMLGVVAVCLIATWLVGEPVIRFIFGDSIYSVSWLVFPAMVAASVMAFGIFFTDLFVVFRWLNAAFLTEAVALALCLCSMNAFFDAWYMNGINLVLIFSFGVAVIIDFAILAVRLRGSTSNDSL